MFPSYFDIHSHINLETFQGREKTVTEEALKEKIWMINVGTDINTSQKAIDLAENYQEGVYATIGMHPSNTSGLDFKEDKFLKLSLNSKVVAVGECGLDYFHDSDSEVLKKQRELLVKQIELANKIKKPLMLHVRNGKGGNAYADTISLLREYSKVTGNLHFFSGTTEDAKKLLSLGFTLSFTGVVTFVSDYNDLVCYPPLDMLMSETDSPYVAPQSVRGKENKPLYIKEIAQKISEIRPEKDSEVLSALSENPIRFFNIQKQSV